MTLRKVSLIACTEANRFQSLVGASHGFSQMGTVPDDASGRRVYSGISRFPRPYIPALLHTHLTSPSSGVKYPISDLNSTRPRRKHCTPCAYRSDKALGVPVSVARIDPSLLDLGLHPTLNRLREVIAEEFASRCLATLLITGAAVAERSCYSPSTKANWALHLSPPPPPPPPSGYSHVGIVSDDAAGQRVYSGSPVPPPRAFSFGRPSVLILVTLIGSQDLAIKSRPNLFTHLLITPAKFASFGYVRSSSVKKALPSQLLTQVDAAISPRPSPGGLPTLPPLRRLGNHCDRLPAVRISYSASKHLGFASQRTTSRALATHQGKPSSIPGGIATGFSLVGVMPDDAAGRRVFSGIFRLQCNLSWTPFETGVGSSRAQISAGDCTGHWLLSWIAEGGYLEVPACYQQACRRTIGMVSNAQLGQTSTSELSNSEMAKGPSPIDFSKPRVALRALILQNILVQPLNLSASAARGGAGAVTLVRSRRCKSFPGYPGGGGDGSEEAAILPLPCLGKGRIEPIAVEQPLRSHSKKVILSSTCLPVHARSVPSTCSFSGGLLATFCSRKDICEISLHGTALSEASTGGVAEMRPWRRSVPTREAHDNDAFHVQRVGFLPTAALVCEQTRPGQQTRRAYTIASFRRSPFCSNKICMH
ncbi:hypothetical protein PR048_029256 [Dryococelus australis]|uniref:Uncharacterized protein n=1 Tax=Dryococelus australis TaxID=614101 RepID=A0ABQ9GFE2_9NEOP|nr:hypothetical protein PR048_029256 [Dryococelus australis]